MSGNLGWEGGKKCFPFEIPMVWGQREEGRIAPEKCLLSSRERPIYHLGWYLTQTRLQIIALPSWLNINNIMHEHNVCLLLILNLSRLIIVIYTDYLLKALMLFFLSSRPMFLFALVFFKVINGIKFFFWFNCSKVMGSLKSEIFTWSKTCQPSAFMLLREIVCLFVIWTNVRMLNGCNKFIPFSYPLSNAPYWYSWYWIGTCEPVAS